jgi:hypothetical protein
MRKHRWIVAVGLFVLIGAGVFAYWFDLLPLPEIEDGDYPMRPVSVLAESDRLRVGQLAMGQQIWWNVGPGKSVIWVAQNTDWKSVPEEEVKVYPKLESSRPLYGAIEFGKGKITPGKGKPYHFVLDESAGTGTGYDRLYFDANRDLDLTNDPVLIPMARQPKPTPSVWQRGQSTAFQPLNISFDLGPEYGDRPVEVIPWLQVSDGMEKGQVELRFLMSEVRKGTIQIGRWRYQAVLGQPYLVTGAFDRPETALYLTAGPTSEQLWWEWWGEDSLSSFRFSNGKFYTISTTPLGDVLKVRRYRGEMGILRVGAGNRQITDMGMSGSLSSGTAIFPVGKLSDYFSQLSNARECEVPVGDYFPEQMRFHYGRLSFWLTNNYHAEGQYGGMTGKPPARAITICKDRPFVLDFSNQPEIMFISPIKDQAFKAGEEVAVETVLTDPVLGTMIRGLDDTTRKESRKNGNGTIDMNLSLAPTVTISDSAGKTVAEGTMPFG